MMLFFYEILILHNIEKVKNHIADGHFHLSMCDTLSGTPCHFFWTKKGEKQITR